LKRRFGNQPHLDGGMSELIQSRRMPYQETAGAWIGSRLHDGRVLAHHTSELLEKLRVAALMRESQPDAAGTRVLQNRRLHLISRRRTSNFPAVLAIGTRQRSAGSDHDHSHDGSS